MHIEPIQRTFQILSALLLSGALLGLAGCVVEDDDTTERATTPAASRTDARTSASSDSAVNVSTPLLGYRDVDRERLARERYDDAWRQSASREYEARRQARSQASGESQARPAPTSPKVPIHGLKEAYRQGDDGRSAASGSSPSDGSAEGSESYEEITSESLRGEPVLPIPSDGAGPTALRVQWMLDRARFSPGIIDGRWGKNTEKAVYWLQEELGMEPTGQVDRALWDLLAQQAGTESAVQRYQVTQDDVDGPFATIPEEYADQAELDCLCYESAEELISEKFHVDPELLAQLNPDVDLGNLTAGQSLWVPNVEVMEENMETPDEVDRIVISKGGFYLHALDENGDIIYHFPSTLGSEYDPSPSGELEIHRVCAERDPSKLPWGELGVDIVLECTGLFTSKEKAGKHIEAGAKKVIISAPGGKDVDATVVYGVNHKVLSSRHTVISNASCTTNCLAPVVKVLHEGLGIRHGSLTTIHSLTNTQVIVDAPHKDLRRARACGSSLIPTSTGSATAIAEIFPELRGRLDGHAVRAPVRFPATEPRRPSPRSWWPFSEWQTDSATNSSATTAR